MPKHVWGMGIAMKKATLKTLVTRKPAVKKVAAKKAVPKKPNAKAPPVVVVPPTPSERLAALGIEAICNHVASGESLFSWANANGFNYTTVLNWIDADTNRAENYARARDVRADLAFESLDDVSNEAVVADTAVKVAGLRLKADNIKWKLARMNAKKYGDKIEAVHSGSIGLGSILDELDGQSTGLPR